MKRILFALMMLQLLLACRNNTDSSNKVLTIANEGLLRSAASTKLSTENILLAFQERKADLTTAEKARFYEPKVLAIDRQANDLVARIEQVKDQLWKEQNKRTVSDKTLQQTAGLSALILSLRDSILLNNPYFTNETDRTPVLFAEKFDQRIINGESINQLLFEASSPIEAAVLLSRLQLNVLELANKNAVIMFENTASRALICTFTAPLIGQSHQALQPNGQLTLEIALGEIRYNGLQKVTVNGKEIHQNKTGTFEAIVTAPSVSGKYSIPVIASYTDQDGKEQTIKKDIKYEVMKCEVSNTERAKE